MIKQYLASTCAGFLLGVITMDRYTEIKSYLPVMIGVCVALILIETILMARSRRREAFTKMINSYLSRHDNDLNQSGAHIL